MFCMVTLINKWRVYIFFHATIHFMHTDSLLLFLCDWCKRAKDCLGSTSVPLRQTVSLLCAAIYRTPPVALLSVLKWNSWFLFSFMTSHVRKNYFIRKRQICCWCCLQRQPMVLNFTDWYYRKRRRNTLFDNIMGGSFSESSFNNIAFHSSYMVNPNMGQQGVSNICYLSSFPKNLMHSAVLNIN